MNELKKFYDEMLLLRLFDQQCMDLKKKDLIYSGYHPYEGQEAVAVGFCGALKPDDVLLSTHRPHCHAVAKGCALEAVLTEMMGRRTGCSGGVGGAMQFIAVENNFYCGSVVGSNLGLATGFALAMKQRQSGQVCMCIFGDGASNHGTFHEALNLAAIWKLPVVFVCENNQFAEAMPVKEFVSCERISMRARGYGLEEISVDGNDVEESRRAADAAIERCRNGQGPVLIEAVTYRIRGHYVGDPEATYRDPAEVVEARKHEPLVRTRKKLLDGGTDPAELEAMERTIVEKLASLEKWALQQEFPTLEFAVDHVGIALEHAPKRGDRSSPPAESQLHSVMPLITFGEAIRQAYEEEMTRDKDVFLIGEDVGRWGSLYRSSRGLLEKFGTDQLKDTPISEAALAGCGVGAAAMGMRPIVEIMYIDFISISMDQIVNHAAKWHQLSNGKVKLPMVFKTQGGAGRRNSSQHSQSLENWFVNIPGLITVMPSSPYDVKGLLKSAIRDDNPVMFIEHKSLYFDKGEVPAEEYLIPLGQADVKRTGGDLTIIATSWMVSFALKAAAQLQEEGISCEVIDPRTLWPLDKQTIIDSVKKTGLCLVVTEAPAEGGWSGEASSVVHENCFSALKKPVKRHTALRTGIPYGPALEFSCIPSANSIIGAARELVGKPA